MDKQQITEKKQQLGKKLAQIRMENGYTKYQICKDKAISQLQLKNIEDGNGNYTIDSLLIYCHKIGYSPINI